MVRAHVASVLALSCALVAPVGCFGSQGSSPAVSTPDGGALDGTSPVLEAGSQEDAPPDSALDAPLPIAFDAGPGCNPPPAEAALSPSVEGVPAAGLVLWLRADRGVYTAPPDGGGAEAAAALPVCAWVDQSGHGWAVTSQGPAYPTWEASAFGAEPGIDFASVEQTLTTAGVLGIGATSPRTLVAVEALVSAGGRFAPIAQGATGSSGTYVMIDANTYGTAGDREGVYMTSNAYDSAMTTASSSVRVHVYTVTSMTPGTPIAGAVDYRVNGATQALTHLAGGSNGVFEDFSAADFTSVGASFTSSTGVAPHGVVAEVLVYDRALDTTERASAEASLEARYGIP